MGTGLSQQLISAILEFLGINDNRPDLPTLDALMHAYIRRVPWESASRIVRHHQRDVHAQANTVAWPSAFWEQAMTTGSGGTCFESNYAMHALLGSLGYHSYLTINDMGATHNCHTAIIVLLDGAQWLVDVGIPLHVPLRLNPATVSQRHGPWLHYTLVPESDDCFQVRREPHPKPYIFTLRNRPVDDADYRRAMIADYGSGGFFLDQVIITRVVGQHVWRFSSADQPLRLEQFVDGQRIDHVLGNNAASRLAEHFAIDADMLKEALDIKRTLVPKTT